MPDFRVADTAAEHAKMRAAGPAALGVWAMGGAYCMNPAHLTDGWVPLHYVQSWPNGKRLASRLVQVGLWREEHRHGLPGYQFHDWLDKQRSAASIEDDKRKAKDRMTRIRSGSVRPNERRTSDRTSSEPTANVHDSLTLTHTLTPGEELGGGGHQGTARARERPSNRCPEHANTEQPPPCGACAEARRAGEAFDRDRTAETRTCQLCDADGRRWDPAGRHRGTVGPCDHRPLPEQRAVG
ncbi:hypothetical protein [Amycolatopsis sp. NPDC051128]|uniref:hypothetical protein n=1 Tax=Amycolatopsis sp. NPDC051128 TaxID=3155412 RepID=UPI003424725F